MTRETRDRLPSALLVVGFVMLLTLVAYAADPPFSGKWKGQAKAVAAPAAGAPGAVPAAGAPTVGAPPAPAGGAPSAPAGGGGGRGGPGGGFGGGSAGPQKVSLNLKQSKENKVSGNITFGEAEANDVKEGKVDGNILTFKAGRAPQPIYEYKGELKDNELILTQDSPGGRGRTQQFVLTKK
jgi:hypothetical protein